MNDKLIQVILSGKSDKLLNALREGGRHIEAFSSKTVGVLSRANKALVSFSDKYIGTMGKLGIGVGGVALARNVMAFDGELRKLGRNAGMNQAQVAKLKQNILELGQTIPLTKGQLLDMTKELEGTGLAMDFVNRILPDVGKGAVAAGADNAVYADALGELLDKYKVAASDLPALQDQISAALKFEDVKKNKDEFLASIGSLSKTMQLMRSQGIGNVTPLLALMAQLTSFTGSSGEAASSLDGLFNGLLRIAKNKDLNAQLTSRGINFFDAQGNVRSISEIIPMIRKLAQEAQKSGKSVTEVSMALFGRPEAAKTIMMISERYDDIMKKQDQLRASTGDMGRDFQDAASGNSAKLAIFQNQLDKFNTEHMSRALGHLSTVLDYLNRHPLIAKGLLVALLGAGGIVMLNKVVEALRGIKSIFTGGGKGVPGIPGGGMGMGVPVFVTNMPGGGLPGAGGGMGQPAGAAGAARLAGLGLVGAQALAAAAYYQAVKDEGPALAKWRSENPYDYAKSQEVMGGRNVNHINMTISVDAGKRIVTKTDHPGTYIDVQRGALNIGDES